MGSRIWERGVGMFVALVVMAAAVVLPVTAASATAPNAPTNPTVTAGSGQVTLHWSAPFFTNGTLTGYVVTPSLGGAPQAAQSFASTATTQVVSGLTNGGSYTFTVSAVNASGVGAASTPSDPITVGAPGLVAFPAAAPGASSATVHWLAPAANAAPVAGYDITPTRNGVALAAINFASTATSQTLTGLTNGATYTFAVAARNSFGTGVASSTAAIVVGAPVAPAVAPVATPGSGQATLTWVAPTANNGASVTGYRVVPKAGSTTLAAQSFTSTATTQTVTGLTNGTSYTFTVAAFNSRGTGPASVASTAITVGAPISPASPTASPGSGQATVHWVAPTTTNGAAVTGYSVIPHAGTTTLAAVTFASTATTQTIGGLTNGSSYTFAVAATNSRGTSPASVPSGAITIGAAGTVPSAPAAPQVKPSTSSASLTWVAPAANGSSITSYVIVPKKGSTALAATTVAAPATSATVFNLTNGDTLTFTIAAVNGLGTSAASPASRAIVVGTPQAPTSVTAKVGTGSATVSWAAPFFSNGTITGYRVTPFIGGAAQPPTVFASTSKTQVVTGLTNGTTYTFQVAAQNANGFGDGSFLSAPLVIGAPSIPAFPAATVGDGQANVHWLVPAANANPITGYVVTPAMNGVAQPSVTFTSTANQQVLTGLTNGASYTFTVAGINASGTGIANVSPAVVVGSPAAPAPPTGTPGAGQVSLAWAAPALTNGSPVTGYVVIPMAGSAALPAEAFPTTDTTGTVTGLTDGTTYTFQVAATNARGTGAFSTSGPAVTSGAPTAPAGVQAIPGELSATVSWSAPATDNGSAVTAYTVTPWAGTTALAPQTFASNATTESVSGLTDGTTYTFTVAATNARGAGPSSPAGGTIISGAPGAFTDAPSVVFGLGQATVSWAAPPANGGPVSSYLVKPFIDDRPLAPVLYSTADTTETVVSLQNGRSYSFVVAAINSWGQGPDSGASAHVVPGGPPATMAAPSVVTGDQSATVSWATPGASGFPINAYVITPWNGTASLPAVTVTAPASTTTVTGLADGTSYQFSVAAVNDLGTGTDSALSAPVTVGAPAVPAAPTAVPGNGSATVTWTAPDPTSTAISGYQLTVSVAGVAQTPMMLPAIATSQVVTGLTNGSSVTFDVAAVNSYGVGVSSAESAPIAIGTPIEAAAPTVAAGSGGVTVSWPAAVTFGTNVTGYVVTPYVNGRRQDPFVYGSALSELMTGLGTGTTYQLTVAAKSASGVGPESPLSAPVTTNHWFCLAGPPTTAADFRAALNHHDTRWQGADGGEPVTLPDGRTLWIFGDTVYGQVQPDGSLTVDWAMAHGSMLIENGSCFDPFYSATTTRPTSLVPTGGGTAAYWPGESWVAPDGKTLNMVVSHVQPVGSSNFQGLDSGIAIFTLPDLAFVRIDTMPAPPAPASGPSWQSLLYHDTAAHLVYLYARGGFNHIVARFSDTTTDFTTTNNWEFWNGSGWSLNPADSQAMVLSSGTFASLSVHPTPTGFVGVAGGLGSDAGTVVAWTSPTPMGPWTSIGQIASAPSSGGASLSGGAHAVQIPGAEPILVWSVSPIASGSTAGSGMGVATSPLALA